MSPDRPRIPQAGGLASFDTARAQSVGEATAGTARGPRTIRLAEGMRRIRATALRSPWCWISLFVGLSFVVRALAGLARPGPWILPDELLYVDLARSIADADLPAVRGMTSLGWGVVYPALLAPAWVVFDDPLTAYRAALVVNALVMSLATVPGYLLARTFVGRRASVLVAGGTVLVPTMVLTGSVMTENVAYPLFITALWLVARTVRSPSTAGQLAALGSVALLTLTRMQGAILLPVLVVAIATYAVTLEPARRRSYLMRFLPTGIVLVGGAVLAALVTTVAGGGLKDAVGGRAGTIDRLALADVPRQLSLHAAGLLVMVAVIPVAASVVMIVFGLSRRAPEPARLFAAVGLPALAGVLGLVTLVGTSIDIRGAEGVNERYLFYLVPLLLVGLAGWIEMAPRRLRLAISFVAVAAVLVALLPFDRLAADATFYAPALVPWVALPVHEAAISAVVAAWALGLGLAWLWLGPRRARLLTMVTASWLAVVGLVAAVGHQHHAGTAAAVSAGERPTWIDDAVPRDEAVTALWDQRSRSVATPDPDYYPLMVTEVLNRSVERVLRLGGPTHYENVLPTVPVTAGRDGRLVDAAGGRVHAQFVLVSCPLGVAGRPAARSPDGRLVLIRTDGSIRLDVRACEPPT